GVRDTRARADAEPAGALALARRPDETSKGSRGYAALDRRQGRRRRGGRRRGWARTHAREALQDVRVAILQRLCSLHRLSEPRHLEDAGTFLALLADLDGQVGGDWVVALVAEKTAGRAQGERGWVRLELELLEATWRHAIPHFRLVDAELHLEGAHVVAQAVRVAGGIAVSAFQSLRVLEWPRAPDVQHHVAVALCRSAARDHGGRAGRGQ